MEMHWFHKFHEGHISCMKVYCHEHQISALLARRQLPGQAEPRLILQGRQAKDEPHAMPGDDLSNHTCIDSVLVQLILHAFMMLRSQIQHKKLTSTQQHSSSSFTDLIARSGEKGKAGLSFERSFISFHFVIYTGTRRYCSGGTNAIRSFVAEASLNVSIESP